MDPCLEDRRSNAFAKVLASADVDVEETTKDTVMQQVRDVCKMAVSEGPVAATMIALATLLILLLVRPPFVLKFEQDQRRPWRGCTRISWSSVGVTVALVAFTPLLIRFIVARRGGVSSPSSSS